MRHATLLALHRRSTVLVDSDQGSGAEELAPTVTRRLLANGAAGRGARVSVIGVAPLIAHTLVSMVFTH